MSTTEDIKMTISDSVEEELENKCNNKFLIIAELVNNMTCAANKKNMIIFSLRSGRINFDFLKIFISEASAEIISLPRSFKITLNIYLKK